MTYMIQTTYEKAAKEYADGNMVSLTLKDEKFQTVRHEFDPSLLKAEYLKDIMLGGEYTDKIKNAMWFIKQGE